MNIGALDHSALRVIMKIVVIWRLSWLRRTEIECVALSLYIFFSSLHHFASMFTIQKHFSLPSTLIPS